MRPLMVSLSDCVTKLKGSVGFDRLAVRLLLMDMTWLPYVSVSLVLMGSCMPHRGSGPYVLL